MTKKKGVAVLQARIEKELREIKEVVDRTEKSFGEIAQEAPADIIINGFAGYVHSFYNGLEKIFNLIAEYVDHFEPRDKAWPQELLKQMTLEIQGLRPAVLTKE